MSEIALLCGDPLPLAVTHQTDGVRVMSPLEILVIRLSQITGTVFVKKQYRTKLCVMIPSASQY